MATAFDPERQFDHLDPTLAQRFNEDLAARRQRCPVEHSDNYGGFWAVYTHDAVLAVASDPHTFSNSQGIDLPRFVENIRQPPVDYDPPEHGQYRKVIQRLFTRQAVAGYEDVLRELTATRIAELMTAGTADLVPGLARYLPPIAIAIVLGLPPEDGERFVTWTTNLLITAATGDQEANQAIAAELRAYLAGHLERQRLAGDDTVINSIAQGSVEGRPLTEDEQLGMLQALVIAGHETTVASVGTLLYNLAVVDGLRDEIVRDPAALPKAVDECLRMEAPVVAIKRTVVGEAEIAGRRLRDGDRVLMVLSATGRDEAVFDRPDEFVWNRERNPHLAFGYGVHRCVGEHLARLEMRVVAEEVLRLAPDFHVEPGFTPQWTEGRLTRSPASLPVVFSRDGAGG
ncbi:cytochrome P450 [Lentzea sp. NPDC051213]|uniref:cytochrome P450 n=1 Tax=Lentzea sp. NPDC051213 TaxID=3364126 RepID=UPI0037B56F25